MRINISPEDLAKNKLIKPGWHPLEVVDYDERKSKNGSSFNYIWTFRCLTPGENAIFTLFFNEQVVGRMSGLVLALGAVETESGVDVDLNKSELVGKTVKGNVFRGDYNGQPKNDVSEWMPYSA